MKPQINYFENLDILRGIAALLVVFTHGVSRGLWGGPSTGSVGVAIFFSLSGFLMGYLYSNKAFTFNNVYKYSASRLARIAPAYIVVVVLSYLIYKYFDENFVYQIDEVNLLRHLLFSGNVSVLWSIPPEVQFYLFFIVFWLAVSKFIDGNYMYLIITVVLIASMIYFKDSFAGTTLPSKIHLFILGCSAGMLRSKKVFDQFQLNKLLQIVVAIMTISYGVYIQNLGNSISAFSSLNYAFICACCIFLLSFPTDKTPRNALINFFILIGRFSFSLYLIHEIILYYYQGFSLQLGTGFNLLVAFSSSILISYLFYRLIENPLNIRIKQNLLKYNVINNN